MALYLSETQALALEQPRKIFMSTTKMCISLLVYVVAAALAGAVPYLRGGSIAWPIFAAVVLLLASAALFKHWKFRIQPLLVLSKEGIQIHRAKGEVMVPWAHVAQNVWQENRVNLIKTSALLHIHDDRQPKAYMLYVKWLEIGEDEYLRLCDLYASASRGHRAHD